MTLYGVLRGQSVSSYKYEIFDFFKAAELAWNSFEEK